MDNEAVKLTQELIRIPSHKYVENRESDVAEYIYNYCKEKDLEVEMQTVEGLRRNVIVKIKGNKTGKSLIFNGHIDTVPPYEMEIDPFNPVIKDGYILGRGTCDMKGAVACMITAMINIKDSGKILGGDLILTAVVGEEEKSEGTEYVVKSGIRAEGAIVGEPTNGEFTIGHRGLEWLEIRIEGKIAHGGMPEYGINAISKAAKFINKVEEKLIPKLKERQNTWMGPAVMNFGVINGGTQPSTVADTCSIKIDRRYLPEENVNSVIKEYQDIIDELRMEDPEFKAEIIRMDENLMESYDHAPLIADPDSKIVQIVKKVLKEVNNSEPVLNKKTGWTDAGVLSTYGKIPTAVTGPGDLRYAHAKDERIPIADLIKYVEIYTKIAEEFCK